MRKLVVCRAALGQDTTLKAAHVEEQVRIVLAVDRDEAVLPQSGRHWARKTILDVPEHRATTAQRHSDRFTKNNTSTATDLDLTHSQTLPVPTTRPDSLVQKNAK